MTGQQINPFNNYNNGQYYQPQNPAMQGGNEALQQAKQTAGNSYVNNRLNASKDADPLTTLALTTGIGYGIGQAMDYFGPKCEGQYDKTILGKLGGWGDKFSRNTKLGKFIEKKLTAFDTWFNKKAQTSKLAYTLKNHSASPSKGFPWNFARMPWQGLPGFVSMDMQNIFEEYTKPISGADGKFLKFIPTGKANHFEKLEQYDKYSGHPELIENFKNGLKGKTSAEVALELQKEELRCLGLPENTIKRYGNSLDKLQKYAKVLKVKKLGFNSVKQFDTIMKDLSEHTKEVMSALEKATANGKDLHVSIWRSSGKLGKLKNHFFGRKASLSEYLNKYKAATGTGNATHLGKILPKYFGWLVEGTTNRFAGGKLAPFMQAMIFADMLYHTAKAPKGEHVKTFAERFVNDFSYFIAMTLGLVGVYKAGGLKYLGTDAAGKAKYLAEQAKVNAKNAMKGFASKTDWKNAKKGVDALLNTKGLKWYEKPLQKLGCIINMGNDHFKPYLSPKKGNLNILRRIANTNLVGVPLRLWLVLGVATPIIVKAATKTAHLIFGKPTNSVLDEDKEDETANQQTQNAPQQPQNTQTQTAQNPINNAAPAQTNPNKLPDSNLIKQTVNGQTPNTQNNTTNNQQNTTTTATTTTTVNNQNNNTQNQNGTMEPVRTYIPSPVGYVDRMPDASAANAALANADKAEQEISQIMATLKKS